MSRFVVQHEFDNEPTYIVDSQRGEESDGDGILLVTLHPRLSATARRELSQLICQWLETHPNFVWKCPTCDEDWPDHTLGLIFDMDGTPYCPVCESSRIVRT
jgi:hypothetical protein